MPQAFGADAPGDAALRGDLRSQDEGGAIKDWDSRSSLPAQSGPWLGGRSHLGPSVTAPSVDSGLVAGLLQEHRPGDIVRAPGTADEHVHLQGPCEAGRNFHAEGLVASLEGAERLAVHVHRRALVHAGEAQYPAALRLERGQRCLEPCWAGVFRRPLAARASNFVRLPVWVVGRRSRG